jgi:Rieske Fe-S protein
MAKSAHISRSEFVKAATGILGTIMGAIIGLPAIGYLISPAGQKQELEAWIAAGPLENYPIGEPTLFSFTRTKTNGWEKTATSYGVFVLRKSEAQNDILALSNVCTHLSCRVNWVAETQEYDCPCHDAQFGIEGEVLGGPPPRPLDQYETKIEEETLYIHLVEA